MMKQLYRTLGALLLAGLCLAGPAAHADNDQDEALKALRSGKIMSYSQIKRIVEGQMGGMVIGQDPPRSQGSRWVYDLRVLQSGGQVVNVEVDAQTGRVLRKSGKR